MRNQIFWQHELIYNNPLYLHSPKDRIIFETKISKSSKEKKREKEKEREKLRIAKKISRIPDYRRIWISSSEKIGMNLSNHGAAGGNFCNGGAMVNGC